MFKYITSLRISAQNTFAYGKNLFLSSFIAMLSLLVVVFLWQATFQGKGTIANYSLHSMVIYIFVVNILYDFVNTSNISYRVSDDIRSGKLSNYLIRPFPHFWYQLADTCGSKLVKIPITLILSGTVGIVLLRYYMPGDGGTESFRITSLSVLLFLMFILLSFLWNFITDYLLGLIGFWMDNPWILFYIKGHITAVFCGLIIPINLFPGWIQTVLKYLPFQYYAFYPYQVLTGMSSASDYLVNFLVFAAWILGLSLITKAVWMKSISRFTAVGG